MILEVQNVYGWIKVSLWDRYSMHGAVEKIGGKWRVLTIFAPGVSRKKGVQGAEIYVNVSALCVCLYIYI